MSAAAENVQNTQENVKPNDREYNFLLLNKKLEAEKEARVKLEQELERERSSRARSIEPDDDDDEPYVDHKKLKKTLSSFEQNLEKKIEEKAEQKARILLEEEKRNAYLRDNADFNQTMDANNVQKFAERHPRLAESILRMPDGFERQRLVYENIKALGIDRPTPKEPSIQEKIDSNKRGYFYQPTNTPAAPYQSLGGDFSDVGQANAYKHVKALASKFGGR